LALSALLQKKNQFKDVPDREGHDRRYAMNADKLKALGWKRQYDSINFDAAVENTVRWYRDNESWWRKIKSGEYLEYYKRQYAARLAAATAASPN